MAERTNVELLAEAILSGERTEICGVLELWLTAHEHRALSAALDLCPLHGCDEQICYDDQERCMKKQVVQHGSLDELAKHVLEGKV